MLPAGEVVCTHVMRWFLCKAMSNSKHWTRSGQSKPGSSHQAFHYHAALHGASSQRTTQTCALALRNRLQSVHLLAA